jgi:hypothetical protein
MWKLAILALAVLLVGLAVDAADKDDKKKEENKIEVKGRLRTGIVAVGAQTTGIIVETKKGTYELELGKDKELRARAEKLDKKEVHVIGTLVIKKALEGQEDRKIILVKTLKEVSED